MYLDRVSRSPKTAPKGPPLLFVHGSFSDARLWDEYFLPYFAENGYETHAFSLRGHGRSEGRDRLHIWRLADYVADLAQAVADLSHPPLVIGHSMGGMVVQKYLESSPSVAGMVLMGSVPPQGLLPSNLHMAMSHPFLFQQMALFSLFCLMDTPGAYKAAMKRLIRAREKALYRELGVAPETNPDDIGYYTLLDLENLGAKAFGQDFVDWLLQDVQPTQLLFELAKESGIVLLPGRGFGAQSPAGRVSLANLNEADYVQIGRAARNLIERYHQRFKEAKKR